MEFKVAGVAKLADARLLKSRASMACGFESHHPQSLGAIRTLDRYWRGLSTGSNEMRFRSPQGPWDGCSGPRHTIGQMRNRLEEEPEPEPDEEPEPEPETGDQPSGVSMSTPVVSTPVREFEYRTEPLSRADLAKGRLSDLLNKESADGWDLVDVIAAEPGHVVLLRRPKKAQQEARRVGFALPSPPPSA